MSIRRVLGLAGVAAVVGGAGLASWGSTLPIFRDPATAGTLYQRWCSDAGVVDRAVGERYDELFTARYSLLDSGLALIIGGLTLAGLVAVARGEGQSLRTPKHRWAFVLAGFGCLACLFAGMAQGLYDDAMRMRFPSCADSIAIPLSGLMIVAPIAAVVFGVAGAFVTRGFAELPVSLFAWDEGRSRRSWLLLIVWSLAAALVLLLTVSEGGSADRWAVPGGIVALYLIASTRAALTTPRIRA